MMVRRLGLGTAPLGGLFHEVTEEDAHAVVERAYELGLGMFDTAPLYGYGLAERRLGHVLADKPRADVVVATKVGRLLRPGAPSGEGPFVGAPALEPVFDFSYDGALRSVEESLERLGLERVDILYIHDPDDHYEEALTGAYRALARLRSESLVMAIGAGMNQAEMLADFARAANFDCFLLAGRYTLLDQSGLVELLPLCLEQGIAVIAGSVYNSGILADPRRAQTFDSLPAGPDVVARALRIEEVCTRHGVPLKAAAIQFPLGHPSVATVLTACRSVDELEENVEMFQYDIPAALWHELRAEELLADDVPVPIAS